MDAGKSIDFLMKAAEDGMSDAEKAVSAGGSGGIPEPKTDGKEKTDPEGESPSKTDGAEKERQCTCPEGECTCGEKKAEGGTPSAKDKADIISQYLGKPSTAGIAGGLSLGALMAAVGALTRSGDPNGEHSVLSNPALLGVLGATAGYAAGNKLIPDVVSKLSVSNGPHPEDAPLWLEQYVNAKHLASKGLGKHDVARLSAELGAGALGAAVLRGIGAERIKLDRIDRAQSALREFHSVIDPYRSVSSENVTAGPLREDFNRILDANLASNSNNAVQTEYNNLTNNVTARQNDLRAAQDAEATARNALNTRPGDPRIRGAHTAAVNATAAARESLNTARANLDAFRTAHVNDAINTGTGADTVRLRDFRHRFGNVGAIPESAAEAYISSGRNAVNAYRKTDLSIPNIIQGVSAEMPAENLERLRRVSRIKSTIRGIFSNPFRGRLASSINPGKMFPRTRTFGRYAGGLAGLSLGVVGLVDALRTAKRNGFVADIAKSMQEYYGTSDANKAFEMMRNKR